MKILNLQIGEGNVWYTGKWYIIIGRNNASHIQHVMHMYIDIKSRIHQRGFT